MSVLRNFERRLEGLVEGLFAKAFRTGLQPVELARRLLREMEAGQTVGIRGVWVPNHYTFRLSPQDRERFAGAEDAIVAELRQVIRENARERGWELVGPPEIDVEVDERLGRGEFRCEADLVSGPDTGASAQMPAVDGRPASPREAELVLIENGRPGKTFPIEGEAITIGRLPECLVVLTDPGVSRTHAEVRRSGGGFVVSDLGSTNGTKVNDAPVSGAHRLEEGDRITIGRSVLEFREGSRMSPFVLLVLKGAFLALLYFFIYRAIRAVVIDLYGGRPRKARKAEAARSPRPQRAGSGKPPTSVVVRTEDGRKLGSHKLASNLQIGRAEACHIRPDDTYVSQFHARIYSKNGSWYVEDLGSTNGTYLNRQRLSSPAEVQVGDQVRVGKTTLELRR